MPHKRVRKMIKILKYNEVAQDEIFSRVVPEVDVAAIVADVIATVRREGDKALFAYTEKFDKVALDALLVSEEEKREHAHRLSHAIGAKSFDQHRAHVYRFERKPGLRLFLMSDGVSDYFPKSRLAALSKSKRELPALAAYIRAEVIRLGAEDDFSWISVEVTE